MYPQNARNILISHAAFGEMTLSWRRLQELQLKMLAHQVLLYSKLTFSVLPVYVSIHLLSEFIV